MGWTDAQQNCIDTRGGTVLVSAAAGSGKTNGSALFLAQECPNLAIQGKAAEAGNCTLTVLLDAALMERMPEFKGCRAILFTASADLQYLTAAKAAGAMFRHSIRASAAAMIRENFFMILKLSGY